MKRTLIKIVFFLQLIVFCLPAISFSQGSNWLWARSAAGIKEESAKCIATDQNGNIVVAGQFSSNTITFGSTTLINAATNGTTDIFVAKYDPSGNVLWAKRAGGTDNDEVHGIAVANNTGDIYISGWYYGQTLSFGSISLVCVHAEDAFLAKYDPAGNITWARSITGDSYDESNSVAVDQQTGNVYITGYGSSTSVDFSPTVSTGPGIFLAKYGLTGNVLWARVQDAYSGLYFGGEGDCVTTDSYGYVYLTGDFKGDTVIFGSYTLVNADTSGKTTDIFIVKYDGNGMVVWAKNPGGKADDSGAAVRIDAGGSLLLTGTFSSSVVNFGSSMLTNLGAYDDIFIAKYDPAGALSWLKGAGGASADKSLGVTSDASGSVVIAGSFFSPSMTFPDTTLNNSSNGSWDIFIVKFSSSGNELWTYDVGNVNDDKCNAVTSDNTGNFIFAGEFNSPSLNFGPATLTDLNPGQANVWVAKLSAVTPVPENNSEILLSVFPNPFFSEASFICRNEMNDAVLVIMDEKGSEVRHINFSGKQALFSRGHLGSGTYFYRIYSGKHAVAGGKLLID